jgi:hypothetical protein
MLDHLKHMAIVDRQPLSGSQCEAGDVLSPRSELELDATGWKRFFQFPLKFR